MSGIRDFPTRPDGSDEANLNRWLDKLGDRQNIDLLLPLTAVASGDEVGIFDVSTNAYKKSVISDIFSGFNGQLPFPSTQNASSNANTLDDYEEGTWTPVDGSGASLSFTTGTSLYVKIGQLLAITGDIKYPTNSSALGTNIGGFPFTSQGVQGAGGNITYTDSSQTIYFTISASATSGGYNNYAGTGVTNIQLSTFYARFNISYRTSA